MTNPILDPNQRFVSSRLVEGSYPVVFRVVGLNMRGFDNQRVLEEASWSSQRLVQNQVPLPQEQASGHRKD